jgi:hypothetical protein
MGQTEQLDNNTLYFLKHLTTSNNFEITSISSENIIKFTQLLVAVKYDIALQKSKNGPLFIYNPGTIEVLLDHLRNLDSERLFHLQNMICQDRTIFSLASEKPIKTPKYVYLYINGCLVVLKASLKRPISYNEKALKNMRDYDIEKLLKITDESVLGIGYMLGTIGKAQVKKVIHNRSYEEILNKHTAKRILHNVK